VDALEILVTVGLFVVPVVYIIRSILIVVGLLKGPILRLYERYGDDEPIYYPLPGILLSLASVWVGIVLLVPTSSAVARMSAVPPILLLICAYFAQFYPPSMRYYIERFSISPRWLLHLREYTTRIERRRIAYMWLNLSPRTRLLFNSSDQAFLQWADFVVLASVNET
jgi:hypothetical protein